MSHTVGCSQGKRPAQVLFCFLPRPANKGSSLGTRHTEAPSGHSVGTRDVREVAFWLEALGAHDVGVRGDCIPSLGERNQLKRARCKECACACVCVCACSCACACACACVCVWQGSLNFTRMHGLDALLSCLSYLAALVLVLVARYDLLHRKRLKHPSLKMGSKLFNPGFETCLHPVPARAWMQHASQIMIFAPFGCYTMCTLLPAGVAIVAISGYASKSHTHCSHQWIRIKESHHRTVPGWLWSRRL